MSEQQTEALNLFKTVQLSLRNITSNTGASPGCVQEFHESLTTAVNLVSNNDTGFNLRNDSPKIKYADVKTIFINDFYIRLLECILCEVSVTVVQCLPHPNLLNDVFLKGPPYQAFTVLHEAVSNKLKCSPYALQKVAILLEQFMEQRLLSIFKDIATSKVRNEHKETTLSGSQFIGNSKYEDFAGALAGLPSHMANRFKADVPHIFWPENYITRLSQCIVFGLKHVHTQLSDGKDAHTSFFGLLLGKICLAGYGDFLWRNLTPVAESYTKTCFLWRRVFYGIVCAIPPRILESAVTLLITHCTWYGSLDRILGNRVLESAQMESLLTDRLLLHKSFSKNTVIQNVIGYLSCAESRAHLYEKSFMVLLETWADSSSLKHVSYEQHLYITKGIMVCISFLSEERIQAYGSGLLQLLMSGIQKHLSSNAPRVRSLGMVVAETLTSRIRPTDEPLKFEYESTSDTEALLGLLSPPKEPCSSAEELTDIDKILESLEQMATSPKVEDKQPEVSPDDDLDSDDDFIPFDMSHDKPVTKVKAPVYVRECLNGLLSSDNRDLVEISLIKANAIIDNKSGTSELSEVSIDLARVLLHLEDTFCLDSFDWLKHQAMVSLLVSCPVPVSAYFTEEFFAPNYNLKQRMTILDALASAAQKLSAPEDKTASPVQEIASNNLPNDDGEKTWRQIVDERIKAKTRIISRGPQGKHRTPTANKFAPVAGNFLFPLLRKADRPLDSTFDLLGSDSIVLVRFVFTLGKIIYASANIPTIARMGHVMLEFLQILFTHSDKSVIEAVLFALAMTYIAIPSYLLTEEFVPITMEIKNWLEYTVSQESVTSLRERASETLNLILINLTKEMSQLST